MTALLDEGKPYCWCSRKLAATAFIAFLGFLLGASRHARASTFSVVNNRIFDCDTGQSCQAGLRVASSRWRALQNVKQRSSNGHVANFTGPQFVFFAGLEGSGHHVMQAAYKTSPASQVINALNLTEPLEKLEKLLFHNVGFMFEHCSAHLTVKDEFDYSCRAPHEETSEGCLLRNAHDLFASIRATLVENEFKQVFVPLNIMEIRASYPDGVGPCRAIKYPSLDRLYALCDYAGVPCRHVYLLRDPIFIERSTVQKRRFNKDEMEALQIHTTQLNVLFAQMQAHTNKLLGCIELLPVMPHSDTIHKHDSKSAAESSSSSLTRFIPSAGASSSYDGAPSDIHFSYQQLVTWFGWPQAQTVTEESSYQTILDKSVVRPPSPRLIEEDVVPPELRVHLSSVLRSHDAIVQLCSM